MWEEKCRVLGVPKDEELPPLGLVVGVVLWMLMRLEVVMTNLTAEGKFVS
jgi:hypothetical protein